MAKNKCAQSKCGKTKCKNAACDKKTKSPAPEKSQNIILESGLTTNAAIRGSRAAAPPTETINDPAAAIIEKSSSFNSAYSKYLSLRELARPLNGLPQSEPLPSNVQITNVAISFSVDGKEHVAEIPRVFFIGDIASLIGNGLRFLLETMHNDLHTIGFVTNSMQQVVKNAANKAGMNTKTSISSQSIPINVNTKPTLAQQ